MAVVTRDTSPSDPAASNHVAVATVVGMVLGVLCLFTIVVCYQFLPRKRKLSPQLRAFAPPQPEPLPLLTRIRKQCTTFFTSIRSRFVGKAGDVETTHKHHRTMRSFHLFTPAKPKGEDEVPQQHQAAHPLRLNLNFLSTDTRKPPRTSKRHYSRLDEKDELMDLVKPDAAVLSPWSPLEDTYPSAPASPTPKLRSFLFRGTEPGTPPPLSPLPPAYLNNAPQRLGARQPEPESPTNKDGDFALPSPTLVDDGSETDITEETQKLIDEIQNVLEFTRDRANDDSQMGAFVICDEDDDFEELSIYSNS